jgi:NAD(P)-dependent dehydrogenase (short-subunit alcohol dehydrogenase family)
MQPATSSPRAILITGAAKRIGRAIALRLAQDGYDIALHYHQSQSEAEATAAAIEALGRRCELLQADLADTAQAIGLIARAHTAFPQLGGMILNASIFDPSPFLQTDEATFDRYQQLHVKSPFFMVQAYAAQVQSGDILLLLDTNITSHASVHFTYLHSKKALAALMPMLARELAPAIRVNAIAPGLTSLSDDVPAERAATEAQRLPLQRLAQPEDIADAAAKLLDAPYLIGHTLFVDGGQHLC